MWFLTRNFGINNVAKDRTANVMHVHSDLVCASGVKNTMHERAFVFFIVVEHPVVGDRFLARSWIDHGHFHTIDRMSADVGEYGVFRFWGAALNHSEVFFSGGSL